MKLTRIELPGFGCISSFDCELAPGLNLFYGDNEAGKSTLQQAICAMLYGFVEGDRTTPKETARYERFRPWSGGVYRGALAYELDDGHRYEVRRDFSTSDVLTQVLDPALGADVTPQFGRKRHGNVDFAHKHLGMSRAVFQSCAFISQGEIFDAVKASPGQIGDAIAALADSARRDVSAAKAIERLEGAAQKIGSDRARTAELPKARELHSRATAELRSADEARRAVSEKSCRLEELRAQSETLADRALRAGYLLHCAQAAQLREQLRELDEAESLAEVAIRQRDELGTTAAISSITRDEVIALRGQHQRAAKSLEALHKQREAATPIADEDRLAYEALRSSVNFTDEQLRTLEAAAYRIDTPDFAPEGQRNAIAAFFAAVARAIASLARGIVRFVLRRKAAPEVPVSEESPSAPEPAIAQEDAIALLEKHRRYLSLRPRIEEAARLESQIEMERESLASIETRLRSLLVEASVDAPTLDAGLAAFENAWRKREAYIDAERRAAEADRRRALVLNNRTREEMAESLQEHDAAITQMLAEHPRLEGLAVTHTTEVLAKARSKSLEDAHRCELEASRLDEDVRLTLERFRQRAEIEEDVAHWEREVARLTRARAALAMAKDAIEQAMHDVYRDFAPAVNAFLSEGMEMATDGKYQRAHVDPSTLRVSLLVPETGQVVTDPPVSHGTRTLLYVLMRIGLAQHMSAIGEPVPLILDDPFVDLDSGRLRRILEFLLHLSPRMQILLFTKDRETLEWFQSRATGATHRIHSISGAVLASAM
ncbi:MAG: AAA family ATPase [Chloroflexota bacterium]